MFTFRIVYKIMVFIASFLMLLNWSVMALDRDAPFITFHPRYTYAREGYYVTIATSATGMSPLSFQWQKDRVAIPGATEDILALSTVSKSDEGWYRAVVTNPRGTCYSKETYLSVMPREGTAFWLLFPQGGDTLLTGSTYLLEWAKSFSGTIIVELTTNGGSVWNRIGTTSDSKLLWTVPSDPALSSEICKIRVCSSEQCTVGAESPAYFAIKNAPASKALDSLRLHAIFHDFRSNGSNPDFSARATSYGWYFGMTKDSLSSDYERPQLNLVKAYNSQLDQWFRPSGVAGPSTSTFFEFDTVRSISRWSNLKAYKGRPAEWVSSEFDSSYSSANIIIYDSLVLRRSGSRGEYVFESPEFFPLDSRGFGIERATLYNHNYAYTMEIRRRFRYDGGEHVMIASDDDSWLFVDGKLVIDNGGLHSCRSARLSLDAIPWLQKGSYYMASIFFAERSPAKSTFYLVTDMFKPPPQARLAATPSIGVKGSTAFKMYNLSTGQVDSVRWVLGDGTTFTNLDSVDHIFRDTSGIMGIKIIAYGPGGMSQDSVTVTVESPVNVMQPENAPGTAIPAHSPAKAFEIFTLTGRFCAKVHISGGRLADLKKDSLLPARGVFAVRDCKGMTRKIYDMRSR